MGECPLLITWFSMNHRRRPTGSIKQDSARKTNQAELRAYCISEPLKVARIVRGAIKEPQSSSNRVRESPTPNSCTTVFRSPLGGQGGSAHTNSHESTVIIMNPTTPVAGGAEDRILLVALWASLSFLRSPGSSRRSLDSRVTSHSSSFPLAT